MMYARSLSRLLQGWKITLNKSYLLQENCINFAVFDFELEFQALLLALIENTAATLNIKEKK